MNDIFLSHLIIYPIKSCRGIEVQQSRVTATGLEHDRRWMLVNPHGKFLSQRQLPRMALLHVEMTADHLQVSAPEMSDLLIPLCRTTTETMNVEIWGDSIQADRFPAEINQWFTDFLKVETQLVHMPDTVHRNVNQTYGGKSDLVSFADAFPFLLISQESLDDLNRKLSSPVPMNRFRPNVIVRGCSGFAEDSWKRIRIGPVTFKIAKPCVRCTVPSVDQESAIQGKEPLTTLSTYRLQNGKVIFGQNCIHGGEGTLKIHDTVTIIE
jgi:uncharacterized protein